MGEKLRAFSATGEGCVTTNGAADDSLPPCGEGDGERGGATGPADACGTPHSQPLHKWGGESRAGSPSANQPIRALRYCGPTTSISNEPALGTGRPAGPGPAAVSITAVIR